MEEEEFESESSEEEKKIEEEPEEWKPSKMRGLANILRTQAMLNNLARITQEDEEKEQES
jgi:hypothetical protein